jgi:hypothetical protein
MHAYVSHHDHPFALTNNCLFVQVFDDNVLGRHTTAYYDPLVVLHHTLERMLVEAGTDILLKPALMFMSTFVPRE